MERGGKKATFYSMPRLEFGEGEAVPHEVVALSPLPDEATDAPCDACLFGTPTWFGDVGL